MIEQTLVLNRAVIFTELPGNTKLPTGTRIIVKMGDAPECDTVAITPTGQRFEFKSSHIRNLIQTPWADLLTSEATKQTAPPPQTIESKSELQNPLIPKVSEELLLDDEESSFSEATPVAPKKATRKGKKVI